MPGAYAYLVLCQENNARALHSFVGTCTALHGGRHCYITPAIVQEILSHALLK